MHIIWQEAYCLLGFIGLIILILCGFISWKERKEPKE